MKKIAVIGANEFQLPLVERINQLGYESHVIAWEEGAVAKDIATRFYPISITENEQILEICKEIGIDAILTAGSDLAVKTVNYVADKMELIGNTMESTLISTNKYKMRKRFLECKVPSPKFLRVSNKEYTLSDMQFPMIVKPTDRSGSRGITKVTQIEEMQDAIDIAMEESFNNEVLIEEYIEGNEYSIETLSFDGEHQLLNVTQKFTTGSPHFIETMHLQPAINIEIDIDNIKDITFRGLDALGVKYGAGHTELKIMPNGDIKIIEIGARMGGDYIGSHLVQLSTGYDFLKGVIDTALGRVPEKFDNLCRSYALVKFIFSTDDIAQLEKLKTKYKDCIYEVGDIDVTNETIRSSTDRYGHYILTIKERSLLDEVLQVLTDANK